MLTTIIAIIITAAGTSCGVWAFAKKVWPFVRRIVHFLDDWLGREETEAREAQPGVLVRLQRIEQAQAAHTQQFDVVLHELFPNSGGSLRDEVKRSEAAVAAIQELLTQQNRG